MRLIYMGTPDFAVPALDLLIQSGLRPVAVATGRDKARGRGRKVSPTPVKTVAERHGISIIQPDSVKDRQFARDVAEFEPDLIVVVAFRILPPEVFNAARLGAFNLHASLLPRFRGAAPIQRALMEGVHKTGVTTFFLREKVDTGNIILQERISVGPNETAGELHDRLAELGARAVVDTVRLIESGRAKAIQQDSASATPAPKISKDDCRIDWSMPNVDIHNHIRALSPDPGAWTQHAGSRLKIFRTLPTESDEAAEPGTIIDVSGRLEIACGSGGIDVVELQREGKGRVTAVDFVNGYAVHVGDQLS
ncbi:MAG: methionyl-tRNA formyltransferase [Rhodothermia bacterium]